jgi:hypothetical protein
MALLVAAIGLVAGCQDESTPPKDWSSVDQAQQPTLFEARNGHPALRDLEGLHLGQSHDEAMDALHTYCKNPVRREKGYFGGGAYFVGCRITEHDRLHYVRLGFWPRIDDRLATLEIKRATVPPMAVRHQALALFEGQQTEQTYQSRMLQVIGDTYRVYADWDEGLDGSTHIIVGFDPDIDPARVTD